MTMTKTHAKSKTKTETELSRGKSSCFTYYVDIYRTYEYGITFDRRKNKDNMTKRPNMCHIFENYVNYDDGG